MVKMLLILMFAGMIGLLFYQLSLVFRDPNPLTIGGLAVCTACSISVLIMLAKKL